MIDKVKELLALNKRADAFDMVYNTIEDLLLDNKIEEVRAILNTVPLDDSLRLSIYLSILTVTRPWRAVLPEREAIVSYCAARTDIGSL